MKRLVLVFGTGRSGTSLMTSAVIGFGFDAGDNLVPGNSHNPEGYFEDRHVVEIHRKLLGELVGRDLPLTPLPTDWVTSPQANAAKTSLTDYLRTKFAASPDVVVKDPRISLLLPLWREIAVACGADLKLIFCTRSPAAVAESLTASGRTPHAVGESIWLCRTMAAAESWNGGFIADFDDMVAGAPGVFGNLGEWLGCKSSRAGAVALVKSDLKHHSSHLPAANAFAASVFQAMKKGSSGEMLEGQSALLARYHASLDLLAGMVERLRTVENAKHVESIDVAYRLIDEAASERAEKRIGEVRKKSEERIASIQRDHAQEISAEREERKGWENRIALVEEACARDIAQERESLSRLTEINRRQELEIRRINQQLGAIKAWRSANEISQQRLTQVISRLNQARTGMGQLGQWGDAAVVPAQWLRDMLERLRLATATDVDRTNPFALFLFGIRALRRGRSTLRRRLLHLHYLIALRSRTRARDAIAIATSGYFDIHYYKAAGGHDPLIDFMNTVKAAKDPSLLFSSKFYSDANPSLENANINPLVHFIRKGKASGAKASPIETFGITLGSVLGKARPGAKRARLQKQQAANVDNGQTAAETNELESSDDVEVEAVPPDAAEEAPSELDRAEETAQSPSMVSQ